ncbi:hypothetical protein RvY_02848-1 [Ramazzottius varieornatus]|uniref:Uncharacterized protein n=1 Tax=Ramazzottius varieornatus TaxID=947166 RepID=A0A1D1URU8_RAMVA|nr:hypothetical protein RvY_02848-1 [Ramazzottius varieornatus]
MLPEIWSWLLHAFRVTITHVPGRSQTTVRFPSTNAKRTGVNRLVRVPTNCDSYALETLLTESNDKLLNNGKQFSGKENPVVGEASGKARCQVRVVRTAYAIS